TFAGSVWLTGGTFTATSSTTEVTGTGGTWSKEVAATFTHNSGKFAVAGSSATTFHIRGNNSFNIFKCQVGNKTITFDKTETNTIANLQLQGGFGTNLIKIQSETNGVSAPINVASSTVSYVSVKDSNNSGAMINAPNSTSLGNNTGWSFGSVVWNGTTSMWSAGSNWSMGTVPSSYDSVEIAVASYYPVLSTAVTVERLKISSGARLSAAGYPVTVNAGTAGFYNYGTLEIQGGETITQPTLQPGSKVRYVGSGVFDGPIKNWNYRNLQIAGTAGEIFRLPAAMTIAESLDITNSIFNTNNGPDYGLTVNGPATVSGTLTPNSSPLTFNSTFNCSGTVTGGSGAHIFKGNWTNTGTYTATMGNTELNGPVVWYQNGVSFNHGNGTFLASGAGTLEIQGTSTFKHFLCTTGGKTLRFQMGQTQYCTGTFTVTGAANNLVRFRSTGAGYYTISFDSGSPTVTYADIQYCTAQTSAGTANTSKDSGDNTNWTFTPNTLTWDGSADASWLNPANWNEGYVPNTTDNIIIANAGSQPATLGSYTTVASLTINAGATMHLSGSGLAVSGVFSNNGTLQLFGDESPMSFTMDSDSGLARFVKATGTANIPATFANVYDVEFASTGSATFQLTSSITVNNSLTVASGSTFSPMAGNITLAAGKTVTNNGTWVIPTAGTFSCDGSASFAGSVGIKFWNLSCTAVGSTLTFQANQTYEFDGTLTLDGAADNLIVLRSSSAGQQYTLNNFGNSEAVDHVDVQDCIVTGNDITATLSRNNGNNDIATSPCWVFTTSALSWDGSASTDWNTGANWSEGYVPNEGDNVTIAAVANSAILAAATTVNDLTINAHATMKSAGNNLTLSGTFANNGTLEVYGDETTLSLTNDTDSGKIRFVKDTGTINIPEFGAYFNVEFASTSNAVFQLPGNINVSGTMEVTTGTFNPNNKDITLADGAKVINSSTWTAPTAGTFTCSGNTTFSGSSGISFYNFTCISPGKTLTFTAGATYNFTGVLTLSGATGSKLNIVSSAPDGAAGSHVIFNDTGTESVVYVDVNDVVCTAIDNVLGAETAPESTGWNFITAIVWSGASSNVWSTTANWIGGVVPANGSNALIVFAPNQPVLDMDLISVDSPDALTVSSGATLSLNGHQIDTVNNSFSNSGTIELFGSEIVTDTPTNNPGSNVLYIGSTGGNDSINIQTWTYRNLILDATAGTDTFTLQAPLQVKEDLNIADAILNTSAANSYALSVSGETTIDSTGNLTGNNSTLAFAGIVTSAGAISGGSGTQTFHSDFSMAAGTFIGGSNTNTFAGNITITGGAFTATSNTMQLTGTGVTLEVADAATFTHNTGTITVSGSGITAFTGVLSGSDALNNLSCVAAGKNLLFKNGTAFDIAGTLSLTGASGNLIYMRSTVTGSAFTLNFTGAPQSVSYCDIRDCTAGTNSGTANTSRNSGNNTNWSFGNITWDGSASTAWNTGDNWDIGVVPAPSDKVVILSTANQPVLGSSTTVYDLNLFDSSTSLITQGYNLTVSNIFINSGNLQVQGTETISAPVNMPGSKVIYTGTGATDDIVMYNWNYKRLKINGGVPDIFRLAANTVLGSVEVAGGILNTRSAATDRTLQVTLEILVGAQGQIVSNASSLTIDGPFTNSGAFIGGTGTHTFNSYWTNTGTYTASSGSTIMNGNPNIDNSGSFIHNSGTVSLTGAASTIFQGSTAFNNFTCTAAGKILTFTAGSTQTINGTLTITGAAGNLIQLRSGSAGVVYTFDFPNGPQTVTYASVWDCTAGTNPGNATNSKNLGNNTNWNFGSIVWAGTTNTNWSIGSNWSSGVTPGQYDSVEIANAANQPVLSGPVTVQAMTINSGSTLKLALQNLSVTNATINSGTIEINGSETITFSGGLTQNTGSKVIFSGTNNAASDTFNLPAWNYSGSLVFNCAEPTAFKDTFRLPAANLTIAETLEVTNCTLTTNDGAVDRDLTVSGSTVITSGILLTNSSTLTFNGPVSNDGTIEATSGNHIFNSTFRNENSIGVYKGGSGVHSFNSTTWNGNDSTFNCMTGTYTFAGDFTNRGTFTGGTGNHTFQGNWYNLFALGNYTATSGLTKFTKALGSFNNANTFNHGNGTVEVDNGGGNFTISGNNTFYNLKCDDGGTNINISNGSIQTIQGTLTLTGVSGNMIYLCSTGPGAYTLDFPNGPQTVTYVNMEYCIAGTNTGTANLSRNSGNNTNWNFGPVTWTGATSTVWNTAANWNTGLAPTQYDNAVIAAAGFLPATLVGATTVTSLTVNVNAALNTAGQNLTVSSGFTNNGTLEISGLETISAPTNNAGSKVTYFGGYSGQIKNWSYRNLKIAGGGGDVYRLPGANLTVAESLDVSGGTLNTNDGAIDRGLTVFGSTALAGTLAPNSSNLTFNGPFNCSGTVGTGTGLYLFTNDFTLSGGTFNATSNYMKLSGEVTFNHLGGSFIAGPGTVEACGTGTLEILGNTTFNKFQCTIPGKTLALSSTGNQTFTGLFKLTGAQGNPVNLVSTVPGTQAGIVAGTSSVNYVRVRDSANTGTVIIPLLSSNLGNNTGWNFGSSINTWTGLVNTAWSTPGNWNMGIVPSQGDNVVITGTQPAILAADTTVNRITVETSATLDLNSRNFTVASGSFVNNGTIEVFGGTTVTPPVLNMGSLVRYTGGAGSINAWNYQDLEINAGLSAAGNITVNKDITISNAGFSFGTNTLNLYGNFKNPAIGNFGAATINFLGADTTSEITGTSGIGTVTCSAGGKTLVFPAETGQNIGVMNLTGAPGSLIKILSSTPGVHALINVTGSSVSYVAVRDMDASAGSTIMAANSSNLGNNIGWNFGANTWTGSVDSNWGTNANWSSGAVPTQYDSALISGLVPAILSADTTINRITVEASSVLNLSNRIFTVTSGSFVSNGTIELSAGTTVTTPTLNPGSLVKYTGGAGAINNWNYRNLYISAGLTAASDITVNETITVAVGSGFNFQANTLNLYGHFKNPGAGYFADATVNLLGADTTSEIQGSTSFGTLACSAPGKNLIFQVNNVQTISNLTLTGAPGNFIDIRSSVPGTYASINVTGSTVSSVTVRDSNASGGNPIVPTNSSNLGHNLNWDFSGSYLTWTGSADTNWSNSANWDIGLAPAASDEVLITPAANRPELSSGTVVKVATVQTGATLNTAGFGFNVTDGTPAFVNAGTVEVFSGAAMTQPNSLAGSLISYTGGTGVLSPWSYRNLKIAGGSQSLNGTLIIPETLTITGGSLDAATHTLEVTGAFANSGTFTGGSGQNTYRNDWSNYGIYTASSGTTLFTGEAVCTFDAGGSFLHNSGEVKIGGTGTTEIFGSPVFCDFFCRTPDKGLEFQYGQTVEVTGHLELVGQYGHTIEVASSQPEQIFTIQTVNPSIVLTRLKCCSFVPPVTVFSCENGGYNSGVSFASGIPWDGDIDGNWNNPLNWIAGFVPGASDRVVILPGGAHPVFAGPVSIRSLLINSGTTLEAAGFNLSVQENLGNNGSLILRGNETVSSGSVSHSAGSRVVYTGAPSLTDTLNIQNWAYRNLWIAGEASDEFRLPVNAAVLETLEIRGGKLDCNTHNLTVTGNIRINAGAILNASTGNMTMNGNMAFFNNSGTFQHGNGTFTAASTVSLNINGTNTFNKIGRA
ncbi:MAG: hypothetical protein PHQ23_06125, partial [Candidatus Wallbacteria bacterium]|nr:hypothetical protein [Candidatus Wallbacteria bacterium]